MMTYPTDSAKWQAVRTKDPHANNLFVYCVKTTKIYCRPICKARLARRSNVEFFDTVLDAVASGYRACKRCRPDTFMADEAERPIEAVRKMLDELPGDAEIPSLDEMARWAGVTRWHFHRLFKRVVGVTPRRYAVMVRAVALGERDGLGTVARTGWESVDSLSTSGTGSVGAVSTWTAGTDGLMPVEQPFDFDDLVWPEAQGEALTTAGA